MKVICINDSNIRESERSFNNCAYQTSRECSLTYGKEYTIGLCKRPIQETHWVKIRGYESEYFSMNEKYFSESEPTWVGLVNDEDENEWYYLDRFIPVNEYRDRQLNNILK